MMKTERMTNMKMKNYNTKTYKVKMSKSLAVKLKMLM